jgi:hypothetical protein
MTAKGGVQTEMSTTRSSRIPHFRSIEEEAEFWDTHDSMEFEDEFEEVEEDMRFVVTRPDERWIPLVLEDVVMTALEERARREQVAPPVLVRQWILERLHAS